MPPGDLERGCRAAGRRVGAVLLLGPGLLSFVRARAQLPAEPPTVRVAVLSLFHPQLLEVLRGGHRLTVRRTPEDLLEISEPGRPRRELTTLHLPAGDFELRVTGRRTELTRLYHGALDLRAAAGELRAVVTLDTELAVASVVAAEAPRGAGPAALEAQAIAARSFLVANLRPAADADTCDTTHCQLLQGSPLPGSAASRAARGTAGKVLVWQPVGAASPRVVAARWTTSCAGHTVGGHPRSAEEYPFFSVRCAACLRHPDAWQMPVDAPVPADEAARERWNRLHPEAQVPSLAIGRQGRSGSGRGHGTGLCQRGAAAMAAEGHTAEEILRHFYPRTSLAVLPANLR